MTEAIPAMAKRTLSSPTRGLDVRTSMTTNYDDLLERTVQKTSIRPIKVVSNQKPTSVPAP